MAQAKTTREREQREEPGEYARAAKEIEAKEKLHLGGSRAPIRNSQRNVS